MFKKSLLLLAALFAVRAEAQKDSVRARFTTGATHMVAGAATFDFPELDRRIAGAGLPGVARSAATLGIGSEVRAGRLFAGAGFQTLITRDQSNAAHRTRLAGSYALVDLGLAAVSGKGWSVVPVAGIGAAHISVNVRELGDFTFDEGLARPAREIGMSGLTAITHAGLLVERRFSREKGDMAVALRGGVMRSFGSESWTSDASKVEGGPAGLRGSYLRLMLSRPIKARRDAIAPAVGSVLQTIVR
jgi:hypothetical protein